MVILGAKGHAKEILDILEKEKFKSEIVFFDNISENMPPRLFEKYYIIKDNRELSAYFQKDSRFVLGVGGISARKKLYNLGLALGGKAKTIKSTYSIIGEQDVFIESGANIMHNTLISNSVRIGKGTLINAGTHVHHDSEIGDFCEICPSVKITGNSKIGNECFIGTGSIIGPGVVLGNNVVVGAGTTVLSSVKCNSKVFGFWNHRSS